MRRLQVTPAGVHPPKGYSHAARAGETLYLAGQVARDADGDVVGIGDVARQARQVYSNIAAILAAEGATWDDIVRTTIYLTDARHVEPFRAVRDQVLLGHGLPPATLLIVQGLAHPDLLIEIDVIAVTPPGDEEG